MTTAQSDWVTNNFLTLERGLNGTAASPVHGIRKNALSSFLKSGFPSPKLEEWKYTNVREIAESHYTLEQQAAPALQSTAQVTEALALFENRLVFVNGRFAANLSEWRSLPTTVQVATLDAVLHEKGVTELKTLVEKRMSQVAPVAEDAFVALNTAFVTDGVVVRVPRGVVVDQPLHVCWLQQVNGAALLVPTRVLLVVEQGASISLVETFAHEGGQAFSSQVTELIVEEGATCDYYKVVLDSDNAQHIGRISAQIAQKSFCSTQVFSFGGNLVRNEVCPTLEGSGSNCIMNGLTVLNGTQHVDNQTVLDHKEPHCESRELYKGVYADKSAGVFSGTIIVRPDAQKTNALQTNQSLLLSKDASVDAKPQLKIWADDVKCTHGATIGQLDEHALFYVRSRGVPFAEARNMLVHAFASDVISSVRPAVLKDYLEAKLLQKLERIGIQ
jgi:Fe-S cluster assembly protein SufD